MICKRLPDPQGSPCPVIRLACDDSADMNRTRINPAAESTNIPENKIIEL
jgi:hypothetical protein